MIAFIYTLLVLLLAAFVSAAPATDAKTALRSAQAAQKINSQRNVLKLTDTCEQGQEACLGDRKVVCSSNGWQSAGNSDCTARGSQPCFALANAKGELTVACTSERNAFSTIQRAGARGGIDGSRSNSNSNGRGRHGHGHGNNNEEDNSSNDSDGRHNNSSNNNSDEDCDEDDSANNSSSQHGHDQDDDEDDSANNSSSQHGDDQDDDEDHEVTVTRIRTRIITSTRIATATAGATVTVTHQSTEPTAAPGEETTSTRTISLEEASRIIHGAQETSTPNKQSVLVVDDPEEASRIIASAAEKHQDLTVVINSPSRTVGETATTSKKPSKTSNNGAATVTPKQATDEPSPSGPIRVDTTPSAIRT